MRIFVIHCLALVALLLSSQNCSAALSGYWPFDTDYTNQQGNPALDGTAIGTGTSITNSVTQVGGGALAIDNAPDATDYVDIAGTVLPNSSINTVVGWYRFEDISADGSDTRNFVWETAPSSWTLSFGVNGGTAQWFTKDPSQGGDLGGLPVVNSGQWHHAAIIINENSDTLSYYHDGSLWETVSIPGLTIERGAASSGFHIGNHRAGDGGRNWDGYIDEIGVFSHALTETQILGLFNKTLAIPDIPTPELTLVVNRDTGNISLSNNTGIAQQIKGYSIRSSDGALSEADYTPLADSDSNWVQFSAPGSTGDLSEGHLTTDTINDGESISLGNAWSKYYIEQSDLTFKYINGASETVSGAIEFTGTTNAVPFAEGDLNFDGDIDGGDWNAFLVGHGGDFDGMSRAQAYGLGDLDDDFDNDMFDFLAFETLYDAANGVGALSSLIASVPEPSTFLLTLSCVIASAFVMRRTSRQPCILVTAPEVSHAQRGRGMTTKSRDNQPSFITHCLIISCIAILALGMLTAKGRAELVAAWTFDDDFSATFGGIGFDLTSANGATAGDTGGQFGNAATFERANSEYASTGGDVLTSGADHSYTAWYNLAVADITGGDRYFVLESTLNDSPSNDAAWSASYGLRDAGSGDIGQVYTRTTAGGATFTDFSDSSHNTWQNIIVTYDADGGGAGVGRHTAYLNGSMASTFDTNDPLQAVGGLVIGGHRNGTGRNFEGQIDDVGFFDHVLTPSEIATLQSNSVQTLAPATEELTLTVDRGTGEITLTNTGILSASFNSYQIDSDSGSLDTTGWSSLDDQNVDAIGANPGESWDEGQSSSANRLIESFLLGNTELSPAESLSLGNAYNSAVDGQDLEFRFNNLSSGPFSGIVNYVGMPSEGIPGDFSNSGAVGNDDLTLLLDNWGATVPPVPAGWENDLPTAPAVGNDDLTRLLDNWGNTSLSAVSAVPEPAAAGLVGIGLASLLIARRGRQ